MRSSTNALIESTPRLPNEYRDAVQITWIPPVSESASEVLTRAVGLKRRRTPTCRIPARSVDLRPSAFRIDVHGVVVQLGKGTDV